MIRVSESKLRLIASPSGISLKGAGKVRVVSGGVRGPQGPAGPPGSNGTIGGTRYYGNGEPGLIIGASPGDEYVDSLTGDLYRLE